MTTAPLVQFCCAVWVSALCWLFGTGLAQAQTISILSGEHEDFTRLVLDIGEERDWELSGDGRIWELALSPGVEGFDIGTVFDRIPRTRLADLADGEVLGLTLACACPITDSRYLGQYLILDIEDAPEGDQTTISDPDALADAARRQAATALPDLTQLALGVDDPAGQPIDAPPPAAAPPDARADIEAAARIMAEQLARAAASGLLEAAPARPLSDADPIAPSEAAAPPTSDVDDATAPMGEPVLPMPLPLRAETAIDAALRPGPSAEPQRNHLSCTGRQIDMGDWSSRQGVDHGLGRLRQNLYDERDRLQPGAVLALVRHYIYYGFGAEAAHWLGQLDVAPEELLAMAALVDGVGEHHFPPLIDPVICSETELLWRYLDGAYTVPLTEDQAGRLQRATAGLPTRLRDQLAPRIARKLQDDGFPNAARNLRDMLSRSGRMPDNALLRLDRDLGILVPRSTADMRSALASAIRDDTSDAPAAMAHAMAFDRDIGTPITDTRLVAAEALLREHGIGMDTAPLWQEVVLAQAARGQLDRVTVLMAAEHISASDRTSALTLLFADRLAERDTSGLFALAHLYGSEWQAEGSLAGRTRVGAIAHLRAAQLTDAAEILRGAQRLLILPARPAPAPSADAMLQEGWQSADWPRVATLSGGAHRSIARRMQAPVFAEPPQTLTDLATRLDDSRALREEISALLERPSPLEREEDRPE